MILVERDNVYWVCKEGCGFESLDKAIDKMAINAPFEKSN